MVIFQLNYARLLALLMVLACSGWAGTGFASAAETAGKDVYPAPTAERYLYDISFLWFDRIATGELSLQPTEAPGQWQAVLEAQTRGVAAWLTNERAQRYSSVMRLEENGLLTSLRHDSKAMKTEDGRRRIRLKSTLFDHAGQRILVQVNRDGREKEEVRPMPAEAPNDVLTAFFNLRRGVYGPLQAGALYRIPTYSRKGPTEIIVDVLGADRRPRRPTFPDRGLVLAVQVDQEVFDTNGGIVYIWIDDEERPGQVVVEKVVGLGDVRSTLREKE